MRRAKQIALAAAGAVGLFVSAPARGQAPSPPVDLADRFSAAMLAEAAKANARVVRVDLEGDGDLAGAPALLAISHELETSLYGPGKLSPGSTGAVDLEIVARLQRVRGRVALGGALTARGAAVDWVLASSAETPEWWPWLVSPGAAPAASSSFVWRRVGALAVEVEDADAGDLDGDGAAEIAVATPSELLVLRVGLAGPEAAAAIAIDDGAPVEPAEVAARAPRTFVRVIATPGGAGEVWLRRTDERRTRVYAWSDGRLVRRADRDGLTLASRATARGNDVVSATIAAGTNRFDAAPDARRAGNAPRGLDATPWIDLRPATLTPTAAVVETGPLYGWLDAAGALRLLAADFGESARLAHCGAAFALADLDDDGKADALCSSDAPHAPDRATLYLSGGGATSAAWSTPLDGIAEAIAAGPLAGGPGALVFVAAPDGGTDVWLLRAPLHGARAGGPR